MLITLPPSGRSASATRLGRAFDSRSYEDACPLVGTYTTKVHQAHAGTPTTLMSERVRGNGDVALANPDVRHTETLVKTGALQTANFNTANFSSIATDATGVIQILNVGPERLLGD